MNICGVEIKGSEAIFAVATRASGALEHVPLATKKIALEDDDEAVNVKNFATQITRFVRDNGIAHIAIKNAARKASSPAARPPSRSRRFSSCWRTAR